MSYLAKRGSVYYFRRVVPDDLRLVLGRAEIMRSLRTKDREDAKRLVPAQIIQSDALFAEARKAPVAPVAQSKRSAVQIERERLRWEHEQAEAAWQDEQEAKEEALLEELAEYEKGLAADPMGARLLVEQREQVELARLQGEAQARAMLKKARASEPQNQVIECGGDVQPAGPGKRVYLDTDILDGWAAERQPERKTKDAYGVAAKLFNALAGRKSAELITKADVLTFKRKMIEGGRTAFNVCDKLGKVRTLLDWAAQNDVIPSNPAQDVRVRKDKSEKRSDWSVPELNKLLAGPVHARRELPKGAMAGGEAACWLPLLALFSGARREEIGQLLVPDVRLEQYYDDDGSLHEAWCINITDNEDAGNRVKNQSSRRLVPLHPTLIELGFVKYINGLSDKAGQIFPMLKRSGAGDKLTDKFGQWFTTYRRGLGIADGKVFHGFRHTWKTHAVNAGIPERICRQFQGHEGKDVADKYGASPSMAVMVEAIASYRVPGLKVG